MCDFQALDMSFQKSQVELVGCFTSASQRRWELRDMAPKRAASADRGASEERPEKAS